MGITAKLREDHHDLLKLADDFRDLIAQPDAPPSIDLVNFRSEFSRQLLAHLTREDWLLYPCLLQSSDRVIVATAQSFIDEMGGMLKALKAWVAIWPTERIFAEWATFGIETSNLLDALARRIVRENRELYPLVELDVHKSDLGAQDIETYAFSRWARAGKSRCGG